MFQARKGAINSGMKTTMRVNHPTTGDIVNIAGTHTLLSWTRYLGVDLYKDVCEFFELCFSMPIYSYQYINRLSQLRFRYSNNVHAISNNNSLTS